MTDSQDKDLGKSVISNNKGKNQSEAPLFYPQKILCSMVYGQKNRIDKKVLLLCVENSARIGQGNLVELSVGQEMIICHHEVCISCNLRLAVQPRQNDKQEFFLAIQAA